MNNVLCSEESELNYHIYVIIDARSAKAERASIIWTRANHNMCVLNSRITCFYLGVNLSTERRQVFVFLRVIDNIYYNNYSL